MNSSSMNFSLSDIEFKEKICNGRFQKIRLHAFANGENAKTQVVSLDVLQSSKETLFDIPIVWQYNRYLDDAGDHSKSYGLGKSTSFFSGFGVPVGFIPRENNDIQFEEEDGTGRIWLVCDALIWTRYSGDILRIIARDGGEKNVSVELSILSNTQPVEGKPSPVDDCVFQAVCILGERIEEAVEGAYAELTFSKEDKQRFENDKNIYFSRYETFSKDAIVINNSAEQSFSDTEWRNPRKSLYGKLIQQKNADTLVEEAYLSVNYDWREVPTKLQFGHHKIIGNQLVLHKQGVIKAFKDLEAQKFESDEAKAHLFKHFSDLGMDGTNFNDFGITKSQFDIYFSSEDGEKKLSEEEMKAKKEAEEAALSVTEKPAEDATLSVTEETKPDEAKTEDATMSETAPEGEKTEDATLSVEPEKTEEPVKTEDAELSTEPDGEVKTEDTMSENTINDDGSVTNDISHEELCSKYQELLSKHSAMEEQFAKLKSDNEVYMSKFEVMSDYEDLKKFKETTEECSRKAHEVKRMEEVFSNIETKYSIISDKVKEELMSKLSDYSSVDAWTNFVKAYTLDHIDKVKGVNRIGLVQGEGDASNSPTMWDKYLDKYVRNNNN